MTGTEPRPVRFADLGSRLGSGFALAGIATLALWAGGLWGVGFVSLVLVAMTWELHRMVSPELAMPSAALVAAGVAGVATLVTVQFVSIAAGLGILAVGAVAVAILGRPRTSWLTAGFVYMTVAMAALIVLRTRGLDGSLLIFWLVTVVVAADVGAYFVGRWLGGPKLWVRVSPGKTWSGAFGGLVAAAVVGGGLAWAFGWPPAGLTLLSLGVAIFSQFGDLLESAVKRHFGVKDASQLIPGHGGVMDRLDGITGGIWFFVICEALGIGAIGH